MLLLNLFSSENVLVSSRNLLLWTGDGDYKPYVSADPDVTTVEMNGTEDFLIIACDGLWDTVIPEDAANCVFEALHENKGETRGGRH
jgi:serine/threonine protein phosphatase PrpC